MRIMIDLDGCVVKFGTGMIPCIEEQGLESDPDDYYFGVPKHSFRAVIRYAIKNQDLFYRCDVHEDAVEQLWELYSDGHELIVVSARKYGLDTEAKAYEQTTRWLRHHGFPPMEVLLVETTENKAEVCRDYQITHAIEDSLENWRDLSSAGIECLLMDRPWNERSEVQMSRVFSWAEFVERING